jgi:hypothetical protein
MNSLFRFPHRVRKHGGECGAVARALHHKAKINSLPAVGENVLLTTNERKSMSTMTNFKRLALGVIAALGLGMLSVVPATATANTPVLTVAAGSANILQKGLSETSTAASATVVGLQTTALTDTYTVKAYLKAGVTGGLAATAFRLVYLDTSTSNTLQLFPGSAGETTTYSAKDQAIFARVAISTGAFNMNTSAAGYIGAKFGIMLESGTTRAAADVGTYTFTVEVTSANASGSTAAAAVTADVNFVVTNTPAALALAGGTIDPTKSTAFLGTAADATSDAAISVVATAATTAHGVITVKTYTSASNPAPESITVTVTGPGVVGVSGGAFGKNITLTGAGGDTDIEVRADGTAGVASIVVKTTTVTFAAKTVNFYAKSAKTITAVTNHPVIIVGANTGAVVATAVDADGNNWTGAAYIYASTAADALIAGSATPVACTYTASVAAHLCPVTGTTKGTANFKVIDASTVALATATSNEVSTRVSTGVASTVKLSFDKATYAPGEKAQVRVQVLDEAGLAMPAATITNGFTTGGIDSTKAFFTGSDATTATTITVAAATSASSGTNAGHMTYTVYMPMSNGVVTISATGGTGLSLAGRVDLSASATVTNNDPAVAAATAAAEAAGDAAAEAIDAANAATDAANLAAEAADAATVAAEEARDAADAATAAVEELATQVATLMAALKAQITTLANTVAKIAKKVKA